MNAWQDWFERRTGLGGLVRSFLFEAIPGGARWRYAWSTVLVFTFFVQVVTGFFLLAHYSGSTQTAWESVYYLQYRIPGGWLLRGLHAISAQAFVVVLVLHLLQVILFQAYRAPRELNFLLLVGLLPLAIGLSTTGWLLPMDQKGFWAARVPLNILGITPVAGPALQQLLLAGDDFTHHTLSRFTALHTTALPAVTGFILGLHFCLTHRLRAAVPSGEETNPRRRAGGAPGSPYWPDQAIRDATACLAVLVAVLALVTLPRWTGRGEGGVELLAPADPTQTYSAARPEWFMLWLFQFLKGFPGGTEVWGAIVLPGFAILLLALMPWIGRWRYGARFNLGFVVVLGGGVIMLTGIARHRDRHDPVYQAARAAAQADAHRIRELAAGPAGIPATGALSLLRTDPLSQGPKLFAQHCASCHRYEGHDGLGQPHPEAQTASDLKGFASREWLAGLLDPHRVASLHYFGGTRFANGKMVGFVQKNVAGFSEATQAELQHVIAALSAEAALPAQRAADLRDAEPIADGQKKIRSKTIGCTECHPFREPDDTASAPDLTGYGSRPWLVEFIGNPAHARFYGRRNDRMPRFDSDGVLTPSEIGLVADWLRGDWPQTAK